jgi:hypothetical protein
MKDFNFYLLWIEIYYAYAIYFLAVSLENLSNTTTMDEYTRGLYKQIRLVVWGTLKWKYHEVKHSDKECWMLMLLLILEYSKHFHLNTGQGRSPSAQWKMFMLRALDESVNYTTTQDALTRVDAAHNRALQNKTLKWRIDHIDGFRYVKRL